MQDTRPIVASAALAVSLAIGSSRDLLDDDQATIALVFRARFAGRFAQGSI